MKTLVILSGGMDSVTLMHYLLENNEVEALSFNYGQRHERELEMARWQCLHLQVRHRTIDLAEPFSRLFQGSDSALVSDTEVPHGHYAAENMKATVVPNRNMMMLSMATAAAISSGAEKVAYAAHAGDHDIYPDCRAEFIESMRRSITLCDWNPPALSAPFASMSKADIAKIGHRLDVPYEHTWSCYEGGDVHCGLCGTCVERREAFELAGVPDPTAYRASYDEYREALAAV